MTEPQLPIEYGDSGLVARNKINNSWTKLLEDVEAFRPSIGENGDWYIGTTDTGIHAEGYTTDFRVNDGYIQYKSENSNVWNNLIAIADLKGDTGNGIESVTATKSGKITTITITFTEDETPYTFQISDGADGQDGRDGTDGEDGQDGQDGADGVGIAGITTNKVGKITTVTVSYTDGSTPDSFEISDGADGQDGQDGTDGTDGTDGNGIDSVTSSKSGKVTTVTMTFTDGTTPPFSFTVTDGEDGQGSGDVLGPSASVDGDIVTFDGVSGKLIKDSGKKLSDLVDIASAQTINGAKTFTIDPILPTKSTLPVSPSSTAPATESQVESVKNAIPSVVDNVTSTSTTSALSANQGAVLKGLIDNLNARGKFLSLWNCATGLPISFPEDTPYTYGTGDYFMVETVDTSNPATNYRPNGSSYNGTASSTEETNEVAVGDFYVYDGSVWLLATNHGKTVSFANLAGQPSDNLALNAELNVKRFALSSYSDTTTGQAIYDYLVTAGKYPIVVYNNESYIFSGYVNSDVVFRKVGLTCSNYSNQAHQISISGFKLNVTSGTVTEIMGYSNSTANPYLATNVDYSSPYTPAYEGSPATKKYVDDNVVQKSATAPSSPTEGMVWYDTTNDVLKTYDGSNWNEVKVFNPENTGTTGQVLTKTATGYDYEDIPSQLPSGGEEGQVLMKTNSGEERGTIETGASDHLEDSSLVGELYSLSNTLFKQVTPTLSNSTIEAGIGDITVHTQIHIQRLGSGVGSNQLKLKLKKVGSPGDLTVQVMKGIQVTVTADSEAYWYGDSNNVLATGTISSSSVTTSFQEITVTLNNSVGGTEGELLDIVLSMASAVDGYNYYKMACDSTQWSECFSFVQVYNSTRTRQKLMPYCVSNGFAQYMLGKVGANILIPNTSYNKTVTGGSISPAYYSYATADITPTPTLFNGVYTVNFTLGSALNYGGKAKLETYYNGNLYSTTAEIAVGNTTTFSFSNIVLNNGFTLKLYLMKYNSGTQAISLSTNVASVSSYLSKTISTHKCLPRELKDIGNNAKCTLYGYHTDKKTWFTGA